MGIINYGAGLKVLVASKGHPYARDGFSDMLDSLPGMACTVVEQPASQAFIDPELAADYDALLFYGYARRRLQQPAAGTGPATA